MIFQRKLHKYYREYTSEWGWGVMRSFDTVMAKNREEAINMPMRSRYGYSNAVALDLIVKLPKKHWNLSNEELEKIYGKEPHLSRRREER